MKKETVKNIVVIGSGNVASGLAPLFQNAGYKIIQIYSRNSKSAEYLAKILSVPYITDLRKIEKNAWLYLIAVKDDSVKGLVMSMGKNPGLMVHTSGSIDMDVFDRYSENHGVFYPLQTFSADTALSVDKFPICIEANTLVNLEKLKTIASSIAGRENVYKITSHQRKIIHLAAVFACNFTNHFYTIAQSILQKEHLPFDLLKPLILETAQKIKSLSPSGSQTGPAVRNDNKIMETQLRLLSDSPEYKQLYKIISRSIVKAKEVTQQ